KGVLGQLLRDGAAALQVDLVSEHVADVHHYGSNEGPEIDAVMLVETRIFDGDDGIQQVLWHLAQRHRDAVFAVQRGDAPSLNVVDVAGQLLLEDDLVERRRAAQVSRQHARGGAENDGDDEYGDDQGKAAERPARQRGVPPGDTLLGLHYNMLHLRQQPWQTSLPAPDGSCYHLCIASTNSEKYKVVVMSLSELRRSVVQRLSLEEELALIRRGAEEIFPEEELVDK